MPSLRVIFGRIAGIMAYPYEEVAPSGFGQIRWDGPALLGLSRVPFSFDAAAGKLVSYWAWGQGMRIHPLDNVEVRGDGHKYALRAIRAGESIIKYGMPIGHATRDIAPGEHVHTQNVATDLQGETAFTYAPDFGTVEQAPSPMFLGYRRPDGQVGIRNDVWVVPTVGCVNALAEKLAADCGGFALTHPYGCSQLGTDLDTTADLLAALAHNPNAGGVLVVGLGCENNTLDGMRERIGARR